MLYAQLCPGHSHNYPVIKSMSTLHTFAKRFVLMLRCHTGSDYKLFYGKTISHDVLMINLINTTLYYSKRLHGRDLAK